MSGISIRVSAQRGAALVVGLLLLLVLTLLAISGMNTASLELMMAGNEQYRQNAFQAAETGIEHAIRDGQFNPGEPSEAFDEQDVEGSASDKFEATIETQLNGLAQGAIWGNSWNSFSTYHFEIQSTGTSARNAISEHVQGVAVVAPFDTSVGPAPNLPSTELE